MKKALLVLAVIAIASPAWAVNLTATADSTAKTVTVGWANNGTDIHTRARAFALTVTADSGATITAINNYPSDGSGYGIYPGNIVIDSAGNPTYNGPVEPDNLHGSGASALGTSQIIVAMGSLYTGTAAPGQTGTLFTITVATTKDCNVTVTPESTYRGGVVGEDANAMTVAPVVAKITVAAPECVKSTAPFYADWVAFGKPNCWCYARNCKGDYDGLKQGTTLQGYSYVYTGDLNGLTAAWNVKEAPKGPGILSVTNGICADFNRDKQGTTLQGYARVYTNDLNVLIANWNVKESPKGPGIPDCGTVNYNFFVNP